MKVTLVLVNYFGEEPLKHFVENEVSKQKGVDLAIVIVDNGSAQPHLLTSLPHVQVVNAGANLGYFGALHKAATSLPLHQSDFVILSNFDLHYTTEYDLANLLRFGAEHRLQVFGPQIVNMPSGAKANPMYSTRPEKAFYQRLLFVTSFYPIYWVYQWLHILKKIWKKKKNTSAPSVYAIHGSMMVFDKTFVQHGSLEHPGVLYGEEMLAAEQCREHGWKIGFDPNTTITHQEHSTTGSIKNRKHMRYLHESLKAIYRKYYS